MRGYFQRSKIFKVSETPIDPPHESFTSEVNTKRFRPNLSIITTPNTNGFSLNGKLTSKSTPHSQSVPSSPMARLLKGVKKAGTGESFLLRIIDLISYGICLTRIKSPSYEQSACAEWRELSYLTRRSCILYQGIYSASISSTGIEG